MEKRIGRSEDRVDNENSGTGTLYRVLITSFFDARLSLDFTEEKCRSCTFVRNRQVHTSVLENF